MFTTNDIAMYLLLMSATSLGFITILYFLTSRSKYQAQRTALEHYELIVRLIRSVQQHRGLSQGIISGDKALQEKLAGVQREIAFLVERLNMTLTGKLSERWDSFFDHWSRLKGHSVSVPAEDSFQQHNHMINNLMYLSETISINSDLGHSKQHERDQLLWRQLLVLTECIGQSRALGASALARGEASYLELIRFQLLSEKIDNRLYSLDQSLTVDKVDAIAQAIDPIREALMQFQVDLKGYPHSSHEFFAIATHALDYVVQILDGEISQTKRAFHVSTDARLNKFAGQHLV